MNRKSALFGAVTVVIGVVLTFFLPLKMNEDGVEFIRKHEAFAACPYRDQGGVPTIGYGLTHYFDGSPVTMRDKCLTKAEADFHLRRVLREYEWTVHDAVDVSLTQSQYNALVSFTYNVGTASFERSGLLRRVNQNPTDPLIISEFMKWVYVKGRISKGLRYRRQQEIELYFSEPYLFKDEQPAVSYFRPDTIVIQ